jgi:hypothetical protein
MDLLGKSPGFKGDPVCDHCFDFCQSILKNEPFRPRFSHLGWEGDDVPQRQDIKELYNAVSDSKIFMDGWRAYVL